MQSTKIVLSLSQKKELENLLLGHNYATITTWLKANDLWIVVRCQKCQKTSWIHEHVYHMETAHRVSNYYKTLHNLIQA